MALNAPGEVAITDEQYALIKKASVTRVEAFYLEQKYDFVIENYIEFEETLLRAGVNFMVLGRKDYREFSLDRALFDRRIMNLLTTTRTYEDTRNQHLHKIFGKTSSKVEESSRAYSAEYDARLGYRAMCKLRNYIQHQGFPVHGSSYHSAAVHGNNGNVRMRTTVDPYLRPEELRAGSFNREVLAELEAKGETVELKYLIRDYMEGLSAAHMVTRSLVRDEVRQSEGLIAEAIDSYQARYDGTVIGLHAVKANDNGTFVDQIPLQTLLDEQRAYLVKKNGSLINLSSTYVSGETVDGN